MVKYITKETSVVFSEIPDEITLAINISNCKNNCIGCHSPYLKQNIGDELTNEILNSLIKKNGGISCVCFMGEGNDEQSLQNLISYLKKEHGELKVGLYSGREEVNESFYWDNLDYLKIGPYMAEFGPINEETTNQRLYAKKEGSSVGVYCPISCETKYHEGWEDITSKFWKL